MHQSRYRTFGLIVSLLLLFGLAAAVVAPAAEAATAYSPPSGAWSRFQSDLNAAEGLATGSGVTIALLSTGVDTSVTGLSGKVTNGPDYIFAPQASETNMFGTVMAGFLLGEPGVTSGVAPDARILSLRTEPDATESGAQAWYNSTSGGQQQAEAKAIRYAADHGAQVIILDYGTIETPDPLLVSAVSYAESKNVVLVGSAFASGTGQSWRYIYPEGLPGVIGVNPVMLPGGTAPAGSVSGDMQSDNSVLISGPADAVVASDNFELDNFGSATAFVAGTVALIKQRFPSLSPALVARALAMSARYRPSGGYSTTYGFGVLDPNDAIIDAGTLAKLAPAAPAGAPGVVAAGGHLGTPPGVVSALPPVGKVAYLYWGLIVAGAVLFVTGLVLLVRRRRPPAGPPLPRRGGTPQFTPAFAGQPSPGQPFPGQPFPARQSAGQPPPGQQFPGHQFPAQPNPGQQYAGQQYAGQQYPGQQYAGQPFPGQQYAAQQYPAQQYPGQQYPGQPFPGQQYPGTPQYPAPGQPPQDPASPYQQLPHREPPYPTRPNWSPLPPPASGPLSPAPPASGQPASGQPASGQPASGQPASGQPASGPPSPAAPWDPAPPPPDPDPRESRKGWFDPR